MQNNRRIIVTGGNGFIGTHLVNRLVREGYQVIAPEGPGKFDIRKKKDVLALPKADLVIHLAGIASIPLSWEKPEEILNTNILGTLNILKYCEQNNVNIIYAGSYCYGNPKYLPIDEDHPLSVESPYAVSKLAGEQLCLAYGKKGAFDVVSLRVFNPYGPGQSEKMVISQMISELIRDGRITIFNGEPKRDFLHIDDLVSAYLAVSRNLNRGSEIYNVGFGKNWSIREIAKMLVEVSGKNAEVEDKGITRPNEITETLADITKIKKDFGWEPKVDIKEGLAETYEWYYKRGKER